jgi:hypothetical protein
MQMGPQKFRFGISPVKKPLVALTMNWMYLIWFVLAVN